MLLFKMVVYGSRCRIMVAKAVVNELMQIVVLDFVSVGLEF